MDAHWERLIGIGLVAGDLSLAGLSRFGGVHSADAQAALDAARASGVLGPDGTITAQDRDRLVGLLGADEIDEIHAAAARHLFAGGPDRLLDAVAHARAAGSSVALDELVVMADHGGRMSLSIRDYSTAVELLTLADEFDIDGDLVARGRRLCRLAEALDGCGDVAGARTRLARAVSLGELAADSSLVAEAAVRYSLPVDWYAGDPRAIGLLERAEAMQPVGSDAVKVRAARALVEMRVPVLVDDEHQVAWVTRPTVAQAAAERALEESRDVGPDARALALLAWRNTHRAPAHLVQRREISLAALDAAQSLHASDHQVDAAVFLAVDALESSDRPMFDEALAVARWVSERDGNPRLRWRAHALAAGAAHLDMDLDLARAHADEANRIGFGIGSPGWYGASLLFLGQELVRTDDPARMEPYLDIADGLGALASPIGRAIFAYLLARCGRTAQAESHVRRALRQLDQESSYLLLLARLADVVALLDAPDLVEDLLEAMAPWTSHVAVDSNGWWCDGPVSSWSALLHARAGRLDLAVEQLHAAEPVARSINDARSLRRIRTLREELTVADAASPVAPSTVQLTERERSVLALMADGHSNHEIAAILSFSLSTIRKDTIAIYRKLAVKGRAAACVQAAALGIIPRHQVDAATL